MLNVAYHQWLACCMLIIHILRLTGLYGETDYDVALK